MNKALIDHASQYKGLTEANDGKKLSNLVGVNVQTTPWCAAFVNAMLHTLGVPGTNSNLARSFLKFGTAVELEDAEPGDIVIFKRGDSNWQGHVSIVFNYEKGSNSIQVLGGNQNDSVCLATYPVAKIIGVRRI